MLGSLAVSMVPKAGLEPAHRELRLIDSIEICTQAQSRLRRCPEGHCCGGVLFYARRETC